MEEVESTRATVLASKVSLRRHTQTLAHYSAHIHWNTIARLTPQRTNGEIMRALASEKQIVLSESHGILTLNCRFAVQPAGLGFDIVQYPLVMPIKGLSVVRRGVEEGKGSFRLALAFGPLDGRA